ncbi:hypothetical protein N7414_27050 [Pseudomonas sp. GD04087]|uniref:hypothetical protein n=1 Tax=unclassified Pseudomonas TaxID=196821 RepID=UPI002448EEE9|nr:MULTISPECIES: hypothetical protein [unclassified Pseudomonas]MDH0292794.1 hypothetical protein [Pseudomonas sp. GD04087]MDH1051344.1 hypothetical protein [Pseudomonas sp. GD03903]MDH2003155.1 hypothetical protein [Pseudomonas sp. GD03691]
MSSLHSASRPAEAGAEHRVKLIPLAVHNAMAPSWGRPWRRRSLSLPTPRGMTFRKIELPMASLRSWLNLLSQAGMLARRPKPLRLSVPFGDDDEAPRDIVDLGLELSTDMILDFAQLARMSKSRSGEEDAAAEVRETPAVQDPEPLGAAAGRHDDDTPAVGAEESVALDSVDEDFLGLRVAAEANGATPTVDEPRSSGAVGSPAVQAEPEHGPALTDSIPAQPPAADASTLVAVSEAAATGLIELPAAEEEISFNLQEVEFLELPAAAGAAASVSAESEQEPARALQADAQEASPLLEAVEPFIPDVVEPPAEEQAEAPVAIVLTEAEALGSVEQSVPEIEKQVEPELTEPLEVAAQTAHPSLEVFGPFVPEAAEPSEPEQVQAPIANALEEHEVLAPVEQSAPEVVESVQPALPESQEVAAHAAHPSLEIFGPFVPDAAEPSEPEQVQAPIANALEEHEVLAPVEQSAPEVAEPGEPALPESLEVAAQAVLPALDIVEPFAPEAVEPPEQEPVEATVDTALEMPEVPDHIEQSVAEVVERAEPEQLESPAVAAQTAPPALDVVEPFIAEAMEQPAPEPVQPLLAVALKELEAFAEQSAPEILEPVEPEPLESLEVAAQATPPVVEIVELFVPEVVEPSELEQAQALNVVAQPQPEEQEAAEQSVLSTVENFVPASTEGAEPQASGVPETDMQWEPVEPIQQPELTVFEPLEVELAPSGISSADCETDEFFEPMISGLADTLAVLAATGHDLSREEVLVTTLDEAKVSSAANAVAAQRAGDSNPEAAALQGILIQKESEMTEMQDTVVPQADMKGSAIPITSMELQEVAAALSVPQLEADPDDVLSDVQNTLNSLAGMAQGLTHQKQAAGRLQEELEEWNIQLQERERLAGDKEERLLQLENHLKQAKTNLDRMAAENNRLLAERSEALKELAQTVDLRDKTTVKRAESVQLEQQRIDEQLGALRSRAFELDERESALKRKTEELAVRLKNLQSAKDKFSTIVKSFNETVQFNSTLSAISKSVTE